MELRLHDMTEYYKVSGRTFEELTEQTRTNGPLGTERGRIVGGAATEWEVRYSLREGRSADGTRCEVISAQVWVDSKTTLPAHVDERALPKRVRKGWRDYTRALRNHEHQHRQHGYDAGRAVLRMLDALTASDCPRLHSRAQARVQKIVDRHKEMDLQLDLRAHAMLGDELPPGALE